MTAVTDEQYRPLSTDETGADDGYSVRMVRDGAANVNNGVYYAFAHTICALPCVPWWYSFDTNNAENVIAVLVGTRIPQPYNKLAWAIQGEKTAESDPADEVTFRIYSTEWRYYGDGVMDTTALSPNYSSDSIALDTLNADSMPAPGTVNVVRGANQWCWLVLTSMNANTATRGCIKSLTVWPIVE